MKKQKVRVGQALFRLIWTIPTLIQVVVDSIEEHDGVDSEDEAELVARRASARAGDLLRIQIHGQDVVSLHAQHDLAAGLARIGYRVAQAKKLR